MSVEQGFISKDGPNISDNDRLSFALFLAIAFHTLIVIGIAFTPPENNRGASMKSMRISLAQYHALEKPDEADFLGQDNQQGGGAEDLIQESTTLEVPIIPDPSKEALIADTSMPSAPQTDIQQLFLSGPNERTSTMNELSNNLKNTPQPLMDTATLLQKSFELQGSNTRISDEQVTSSRKDRRRPASAAIHSSVDALYLDKWRQRIEQVGNQNYPLEASKKNIYGEVLLKISIKSDGSLEDIKVLRSSGHKILDESAMNIARLAAPYDAFDEELKKSTDILDIIRTWEFKPGNKVKTQ